MLFVRILEDTDYNSLKLHFLNQVIYEKKDITKGQVVMGTIANKALLKSLDLYYETIETATASDLIVAIKGPSAHLIDEIISEANDRLLKQLQLRRHVTELSYENYEFLENEAYLMNKEVKSDILLAHFIENRTMGRIHSVFQSSLNLMFADKLINISTQGMPLAPHGCTLSADKIQRVLATGRVGDLVKMENNQLTFYTVGDIFNVDLNEIETINLTLPRLHLSPQEVKESNFYQILKRLPFHKEIGLEMAGETAKSFDILEAFTTQDDQAVRKAMVHLLGRGHGLTPSGDDILLGFGMIQRALLADDRFLTLLQDVLNSRKTTVISEAYFEGLFLDHVNSLFKSLILAMQVGDEEVLNRLIGWITRYGHTSGYDTLFGMFLGASAYVNLL